MDHKQFATLLARAFAPVSLPRKAPKRYPSMVTSSPEEIAAHNRAVKTRQVLRHQARRGG